MILFWLGFFALVAMLLVVDLGVLHKRGAPEPTLKSALGWTVAWVAIGLLFAVFVYFMYENHWLGVDLVKCVGMPPDHAGDGPDAAETYVSAHRYPASRFVYTVYPSGVVPWFAATHAEEASRVVPGSQQLLLDDLEASEPELVIDAGRSMKGRYMYAIPLLRRYLDRHYCFARFVDGEPIYRRRHDDACPPADY